MKPLALIPLAMRRSGIREVMDLAGTAPDVLHLEVGEPDFPTPAHIVEAAVEAARAGFTRYTPNAGLPELREAIAQRASETYPQRVAPSSVVVTSGSVGGLFTTLMALVDPGDEVLIPDPGWPNYEMIVRSLGAVPVRYALDANQGFEPDLAALAVQITSRAKALLVNTPSNPTGAVFSEATVRRLCELAERHDLYVVSDEVYDRLVFQGAHCSLSSWDAGGRVICVNSFSKTYAMTGWRVGYVIAPPAIASVVTKLQEPIVSCASAVSQQAALAALRGPQECVAAMCREYQRRRDLAASICRAAGVRCNVPQGAFYLLVDVSQTSSGHDTYAFARRLLRDQRVAVAPGETFGNGGAGLVRVSLATDPQKLELGVSRLAAAVARGGGQDEPSGDQRLDMLAAGT